MSISWGAVCDMNRSSRCRRIMHQADDGGLVFIAGKTSVWASYRSSSRLTCRFDDLLAAEYDDASAK